MDPLDREVLALRHFEQLTPARDRGGAGHQGEGRRHALRPRLATAQGDPHQPAATGRSDDHERVDLGTRPVQPAGRRVRRALPPGRAAAPERVHRKYPELADQIRELFPALVAMEQFGSGRDQAAGPVRSRGRRPGAVPERLGDYRILREIGRGGMGIVYEAVQESWAGTWR